MTPAVIAWVVGAVVLLAVGLWPLLRSRSTGAQSKARDEADALISRLNFEIERSAPTTSPEARRRAEHCALLAGAALAGSPSPAACRRSQQWSRSGLKALRRSAQA